MKQAAETQSSNLLAGRHALVTGGSRGIGAAVTQALLAHGARVSTLGRSPASSTGHGGSNDVAHIVADVGDFEAVKRATDQATRRYGSIDILVNNAGQAASAPFVKMDASLWRTMITVNLDGTFYCTRAALPGMLAAGWGRVVNIASTAGLTGYGYVSAYCAAKHGVIGLTRALALEVATKGITVNAVCPGYTDTEMVGESVKRIVAKTGRTSEQALADLIAQNPQKRLIQPAEVANAVAWLCLPGSESVTGQAIAISGGEVM
jgi:NAD(P)-dependent dehydrogenase (short-subunit alcohol dehydrogenase family)